MLNRLNKIIKTFFLFAAGIIFAGCNQFSLNTEEVKKSDSKKIIKITTSELSRTVLPSVSEKNLTNLVMYGVYSGEEAPENNVWLSNPENFDTQSLVKLGAWNTLEDAEKAEIEIDYGWWSFLLMADHGNCGYYSPNEATLVSEESESVISFELMTGKIIISSSGLSYKFPEVEKNPGSVELKYHFLDDSFSNYLRVSLLSSYKYPVYDFKPIVVPVNKAEDSKYTLVNFEADEGNYFIYTEVFYDSELNLKVGEHYEAAIVEYELNSQGEILIGDTKKICTVNYETNGGEWRKDYQPKTEFVEGQILYGSENISRDNLIFDGWYSDSNYSKRITVINEDCTLYAKWMINVHNEYYFSEINDSDEIVYILDESKGETVLINADDYKIESKNFDGYLFNKYEFDEENNIVKLYYDKNVQVTFEVYSFDNGICYDLSEKFTDNYNIGTTLENIELPSGQEYFGYMEVYQNNSQIDFDFVRGDCSFKIYKDSPESIAEYNRLKNIIESASENETVTFDITLAETFSRKVFFSRTDGLSIYGKYDFVNLIKNNPDKKVIVDCSEMQSTNSNFIFTIKSGKFIFLSNLIEFIAPETENEVYIEGGSFYGSGLTKLTLSEKSKVINMDFTLFNGTQVKEFTFTENLSTEELPAFLFPEDLNITISEGNKLFSLSDDGNYIICNEGDSKVLLFPPLHYTSNSALNIPEGVTRIEKYYAESFYDCPPVSITLPSTLEELNYWTLPVKNVDSLTIPASVKDIYKNFYYEGTLTELNFETTTGWYYKKSNGTKVDIEEEMNLTVYEKYKSYRLYHD